MVTCIGNYCIDASGWLGTILNVGMIGTITIIFFGVIGWVVYYYYQKGIYIYPITLTKVRENGSTKEVSGLKGGLVKGKGGIQSMKVKIPKKLLKKNLGYVPDLSLADSDNRLHFIQIGDGSLWQQTTKKITYETEVLMTVTQEEIKQASDYLVKTINEQYSDKDNDFKAQIYDTSYNNWIDQRKREVKKVSLLMEPVPTDIKTVTINAIHDVQQLTEKNKMTATIVGIIAFVIMAIVQIAFLYFTRKK